MTLVLIKRKTKEYLLERYSYFISRIIYYYIVDTEKKLTENECIVPLACGTHLYLILHEGISSQS